MSYKRILTIQDISCLGQCSITVALPILSACGHETCILPSAVLSTHTGGFTGFTVRDLTEDLPAIEKHWNTEGITFDAIYTGYLGSAKQIDYVESIFRSTLKADGKIVVDPAMADHGKLYTGFDMDYVEATKKLCRIADVILPNITEACLLTRHPYQDAYDEKYAAQLLQKLHALGCKCVVLTGVSYQPDLTGAIVSDGRNTFCYTHRRIQKNYHGTGDIFSSSFVGAWMKGQSMPDAVKTAADYTVQCIENTIDDDNHRYGVKFETAIPMLVERLK